MSESKQRAKSASDEKIIEATEQERAALGAWLNTFAPDNRHDRRLCEALHADLQLDAAREHLFAALKEKGDQAIAEVCSGELAEYVTTKQVIEYLLKIVDTKIPRNLGKHILTLEETAIAVRDEKPAKPAPKPADGETAAG